MKMGNMEIDKKNREAKIVLDTRYYGYGAVLQAAKDFSDSCWVLVDGDKDDKLLVTLKPKTKDIKLETLGYEFMNYALSLIQDAIAALQS